MDITACVVQGMINALEKLLAKGLVWYEGERKIMEIELKCCRTILTQAEAYQ